METHFNPLEMHFCKKKKMTTGSRMLELDAKRESSKRESKKRDREKGESGKYESGSGKQRGGSGKRKAGQLG